MLKNKKTMRIFSLILAISMLLSFSPYVMASEATDTSTDTSSWLFYEENFDVKGNVDFSKFKKCTENQMSTTETNLTDAIWKTGGTLAPDLGGGNDFFYLHTGLTSDKIADDSVIVYEVTKKTSKNYGGDFIKDGVINWNGKALLGIGGAASTDAARVYAYDQKTYLCFQQGVKPPSGATASASGSDYQLKVDEYYTYKLKYRKGTSTYGDVSLSVCNATQGEATTGWNALNADFNPDLFILHYNSYYFKTEIDSVRVYDESKLPKATVTANDGVDVNAVKENDKFTVTLGNAITKAELDASPITVKDSDVEIASVLSEDGKKITLTVSNLASSKEYTLTVPDLGLNVGTTSTFKTAQADYVLYANYFDTEEDVANSGFALNGTTALTASAYKNGNFNYMNTNPGGSLILNKDISSKLADNSVIVYETRKQVYSYSSADQPFGNGLPLFFAGADNHQNGARIYAVLNEDKTTAKLYLTFNSGGGADGSHSYKFADDFAIKKGNKDNLAKGVIDETGYFTYTIKYDKKNNKVKAIVSNYNGTSIAESDWCEYPYEFKTSYSGLYTSYFTGSFVDYHIIYDKAKLPKAKLAETDLKSLKDGSTLTVNFEQKITESDLSKITVTGGAEIEKTLSEDRKSVTLTFSKVENLKSYTLKVEDIGMNLGFTETLIGADYDYMLYRNDFDTADDINNGEFTFNNTTNNTTISGTSWDNGELKYVSGADGLVLLTKDISSKLNDNSVVVYETRKKMIENYTTGLVNTSTGTKSLFLAGANATSSGARLYYYNGNIYLELVQGDDPTKEKTSSKLIAENYSINKDDYYTYKIKYNKATKQVKGIISNETQGTIESDWYTYSGTFNTSYSAHHIWYYRQWSIDYVHIYDESLIPVPTVSGGDLMNLHSGDKLTINFPFAVTLEELAGKVKIGDNVQSLTLSEDGKTAELTLSDIALRTKYTLTIEAVGENSAVTEQLRGGEEGKYYYRAEFDGNDDTSKIYSHWSNSNFAALNTSAISNGVLDNSKIAYRRYSAVFGNGFAADTSLDNIATKAINVEGKENVVFETKIKFDGNNIWNDKNNFLVINRYGIALGYENGLMYASNSGNPDTYFKVNEENYQMLADTWYTITIRMNFATSRYTVSVSDGKDVATSGVIPFMYYNKHNTITGIGMPSRYDNNYANFFVDYMYLYDDDYGKSEVTYNNGVKDVPLDGSVLVKGDETYKFEAFSDIEGEPVITAKTADGTALNVNASKDGRNVTFNITETVPADTQIYVTIDKATLGAEKDQVVSFRTKWDENAEFVTPEMFADKDTLDVVFFGGSITAQDGWRTTVTNGLDEMFADKTVKWYNESWGGTGAEYGWTRLDKCVKPHNPDVVFVEYAVNDSTNSGAAKYMESVIRSMNAWDKKPVIILVYTTKVDFRDNAWACSEHTRVAEAYGVPYISAREYVMSKYNEDDAFATDWDGQKYLPDGTHTAITNPDGTRGFALYGDYVNNLLKHHSDHYFKLPKANSAVEKLDSASREETLAYTAKTETMTEIGDSVEFTFSGDELVLEIKQRDTAGKYTLIVDGNAVATKDSYTNQARPSDSFYSFSGFGSGEHTAKVVVAGEGGGKGTTVEFIGYYQLPKAKATFAQPTLALSDSSVKATFGYTTEEDTAVTFILVAYKADGTLANIQFVPTTLLAGTTSSSTIMPDDSSYASFKAFVWDSLGSMQAKCVSGELVKTTSAE